MEAFKGSPAEWDALIAGLPDPHLLQTWEWSQVKAGTGWQPLPHVWADSAGRPAAAAMLLKRTLPSAGFAARLCLLYIPRGPLMDWSNDGPRRRVLDDLQAFARRQGAIFVKIDPDVVLGTGVPGEPDAVEHASGGRVVDELVRRGWRFADDQIQFRNTVMIDLAPAQDQLLARMKQKTRYNVRLAEKKGVTVRTGSAADYPLLYKMYAETSVRDGFVIRDESYYRSVWTTFSVPHSASGLPRAEPLIAEVDGEPVAGLFLFHFADRAYYIYGMSREAHREKMPNYLLQWEAMRRAKALGCSRYDLWGAPDGFDGEDSMQGVFRFKQGLGGEVLRTLGAWDYASRPFWYWMYTRIVPRILDVMRLHGWSRTREAVS